MFSRNRPSRIVALDWDTRNLRCVHALLGKRGVKIDQILSVAMPTDLDVADPRALGLHIRRLLDQAGINTKHAIVDIPRDQAILKTLTLPTTQPDQLPGMVEIQIAKELSFPAEEALIDFTVAPGETDEPTGDVLVAAVRRELVEQYEAAFVAAGLKLDRIGLRPYANKVAAVALLKHAMPERVLFIDVRPTFMEIDVLRNGALVFSRSASVTIPVIARDAGVVSIAAGRAREEPGPSAPASIPTIGAGPMSVTDPAPSGASLDPVVSSLIVEVTRSIEAYRATDPSDSIDHVVIGGDVGVEEALAEAIQKHFNVTVELYNPASTFGWEPDEGVAASAHAASLGLVLGHAEDDALHFDFLHPKRSISTTQKRLRKAPAAAAVAILFLTAGGVVLAGMTGPGRVELARIQQSIKELKGERSKYRKFLVVSDAIKAFDEEQQVWIDVLHDVISVLPSNQEVVINSMEMNQKEGRLTLKTRMNARATGTEVVRRLKAFRRPGRDKPRYEVSMGTQSLKTGDKYPFVQELRISLLDDAPRKKKLTSRRRSRG